MDRVDFITKAVGEVCKQTPVGFVHLGVTVCENADLTVAFNGCVPLANVRWKWKRLPWYNQPHRTAPAHNFRVRMPKAERMDQLRSLYGCVT